jgi:hypothetical protein
MRSTLSFSGALADVVMRCKNDLADIETSRARMKSRLNEAAALYGIDPTAVRRLLVWVRQQQNNADRDQVDLARQEEIDQAYRAVINGGTPTMPRRADAELDKVMLLVKANKPPKIDSIMEAVGCSRGKAHKLRTLAAARLAAKSSSSSKSREHELSSDLPPPARAVLLQVAGLEEARLQEAAHAI